jgi:signal transduction histidine kinase
MDDLPNGAAAPWDREDAASRSLLRLIVQSTNDGVWDWDLETDEVYYSPRWLELIGYLPGELRGHIDTFIERLHPDDRAAVERLETMVAERTTDLRAARDRAELANAATTKFLATASHDIRQPLQAMALLLGGLKGEVATDEGARKLLAIERSLASGMELLDALLEFSKLDAGALRPRLTTVGIGDLFDIINAILEDDPAIAEALTGLLQEWGALPIAASDDDALLRMLAGRRPDAVIADRDLGEGGDGFTALSRLETTLGGALPSLVLTGDYDARDLERVNAAGRRVLHKPVWPAVLHAVLRFELSRPIEA